jgi:hypothetical protein
MEFNLTQVALATIAAIAATGITIKIVSNKKAKSDDSVNNVKQKGISTLGDVAGRDINKKP